MQNRHYIVNPISPGTFDVRDGQTGAQLGRFNVPGDLINGPIISNDTCSITTRASNVSTTYVVKLPSGYIINRFVR